MNICKKCDYVEMDRWDWYCNNIECIARDKHAKIEMLVYGKGARRGKLKCSIARLNVNNCGEMGRFYEAKK